MKRELATLAALLAFCTAATAQEVCRQTVDEQLRKYGISRDSVRKIDVIKEKLGGTEGVYTGYKFWMRMKGCDKGYLVIDTNLQCYVEQVFAASPCRIPGVPQG